MSRARFSAAFERRAPNLGPQDVERGVVDTVPDEGIERFLCALIGLVLNRKKDVELVYTPTWASTSYPRHGR